MHIILAILGAAAAFFWVAGRVVDATKEDQEAAQPESGAVRHAKWARQVDGRLIESIEDPREVVALLMAQIAAYEGEITRAQKNKMKDLMRQYFAADEQTAESLYSFGRMAIGQINGAANSLRKILRPVVQALTTDEKKDLVLMLEEVAAVEGNLSERQRRLIIDVRRALSLS